jgi:hypothetical protein
MRRLRDHALNVPSTFTMPDRYDCKTLHLGDLIECIEMLLGDHIRVHLANPLPSLSSSTI